MARARSSLQRSARYGFVSSLRLSGPCVNSRRIRVYGCRGVETRRGAARSRRRMGSASAAITYGWRASGAELARVPLARRVARRGAVGRPASSDVPRVLDSKAVRGVGNTSHAVHVSNVAALSRRYRRRIPQPSLRSSLPTRVARSLCLVHRRRDSVSSAGLGLITFPPDRSAESRPRQVAPAFGHPVMLGLARHRILHPIPTRWTAGPLACAFPRDAHEHYGLGGSSRRLLASRSRPEPPRRPRRGPLRNHGGRVWPSIGFSFNQASELP
jgi:hypothetical protein